MTEKKENGKERSQKRHQSCFYVNMWARFREKVNLTESMSKSYTQIQLKKRRKSNICTRTFS